MLTLFGAWGSAQAGVNVILYDTDGKARVCSGDIQAMTGDDTGKLHIANAACFASIGGEAEPAGETINFYNAPVDDNNVEIRKCGYKKVRMFPDGMAYIEVDPGCIAEDDTTIGVTQNGDDDKWSDREEYINGTDPNAPDPAISIVTYDADRNARECFAKSLKFAKAGELRVIHPADERCFSNVAIDGLYGKVASISPDSAHCEYGSVKMFPGGNIVMEVSTNCISDDGVTADADSDRDGKSNIDEYLAGTDPEKSNTGGGEPPDGDVGSDGTDTDGDGIPDVYDAEPLVEAGDSCEEGADHVAISNRTYVTDGNTCQARISIMTGENVSVGDANDDGGVTFVAGETIHLFPGFQVWEGSSFTARIDPDLIP